MARSVKIEKDTRTTQQRKMDAVHGMYARVDAMGADNWTAGVIAKEIRSIAGAIRSQAWREAVESYALFVEDNPEHVYYGYSQGSVYFASQVF